jgi:hypothetical protein
VVLDCVPPYDYKILMIKIVRAILGFGLAEAKYWIEGKNLPEGPHRLPFMVFGQNLTKSDAELLFHNCVGIAQASIDASNYEVRPVITFAILPQDEKEWQAKTYG